MKNYQLIELETVDSTNRYLKDYCSENLPDLPVFCITDQQTSGYGQQQRSWLTNEQSAVFSLAYPIAKNILLKGIASLHIAALVHRVLTELQATKLFLKWPNDLVTEQGKVAGILVEQVMQKDYRAVIIGVGINRSSVDGIEKSAATEPFDLKAFIDRFFDLLNTQGLVEFDREELYKYWRDNDFFSQGEKVKVSMSDYQSNDDWQEAVYLGIDSEGRADISIQDESELKLVSGQNSIRKIGC